MSSPPSDQVSAPASWSSKVLDVDAVVKHFSTRTGFSGRRRGDVHAVCGVSFSIAEGSTLGLVGESGCGKSTIARLVLGLTRPTAGRVSVCGSDIFSLEKRELRALRRRMQIVFQDPSSSFDPRMTIGESIAQPLRVHRLFDQHGAAEVRRLMALVELDSEYFARYPHELSGGQRQRAGIARALALRPDLLVLDEPVSSLDTSIQADVVNLLADLQEQLGVAYLFIAHDLSVVHHLADQVAVMYLGRIVESGSREEIFEHAAHPYTQALISSAPIADPDLERDRERLVLVGDVPSAISPPSGCRFRTRCWKAQQVCADTIPELLDRGQGHPVACHFAEVITT